MKLLALALGACLFLSGCATVHKDWSATGGSKADGVVRLSYEQTEFETVIADEAQGVNLAKQRCSTWGYSGAEAFGGTTRQCQSLGGFNGCSAWLITKEYQCTDTAK